jgi:hypothetical protein
MRYVYGLNFSWMRAELVEARAVRQGSGPHLGDGLCVAGAELTGDLGD